MPDWLATIIGLLILGLMSLAILVFAVTTIDFITDIKRAICGQPRLASHRRKE